MNSSATPRPPGTTTYTILSLSVPMPTGRTLIFGSTGLIGWFIAEASLESGRPTYLLARSGSTYPSTSSSNARNIKALQDKGAIIIQGSINNQDLVERILREYEIQVVISAVGEDNILDQVTLIDAIKSVGTVKRFLPSEFGHDIDRAEPVEPGLTMYCKKRKVRRLIEETGIPYTYICCNSIAAWPYHDDTHPCEAFPPLDQFKIYGDGTVKAYFVAGSDIGKFTMRTVDDNRTLNKSVHFRPPQNCLSVNELASLWEKKIKRTLPRVTVTEDDLLLAARENCIPKSIAHDIFIKGCQVNFSIDGPDDLDVSLLYPDISFRSIGECFDDFIVKLINQKNNHTAMVGDDGITIVDMCLMIRFIVQSGFRMLCLILVIVGESMYYHC